MKGKKENKLEEIKITKEKILEAAKMFPHLEPCLKTLFSEAFRTKYKVGALYRNANGMGGLRFIVELEKGKIISVDIKDGCKCLDCEDFDNHQYKFVANSIKEYVENGGRF